MLINDENGNIVTRIDYGKVYYSSAYLSFQLLYLVNETEQSMTINTDCFTAEDYPAAVKLIETEILNDCEPDCIRMLLELPQFDIVIPPKGRVEVRAYLVFNFTSEDLFAYSDHKRVGGTSYFRISLSLVFKSKSFPALDSMLHLHASACNSLLSADDTEIEFDSCIVGNTYVRDVQIWNKSECVLLYRITPHGGKISGKLPVSFSDFETGKVISIQEQLSIPAFSSQRLRITLKAKVPCEVVRSIRFENDYNSSNIVILNCRISVTAKELADDLVMETESGIQIIGPFDFGDCYHGVETTRKVWLRNNSQDTVEVSISSDSSMICFDLGGEKEKYLDRPLISTKNQNQIPLLERDSSSQSTMTVHRSFKSEDDEKPPTTQWKSNGIPRHRDGRDRTGKEILKFQSKDHRYSSNYFGIDEFSGDFNDDELCPGSQLQYQRYFNSRIQSNGQESKSPHDQSGGRLLQKTIGDIHSENINPSSTNVPPPSYSFSASSSSSSSTMKRYHDSVIVLPPGTRRLIQFKLIPMILPSDRNRSVTPMIHSKNPVEELLDDSLPTKNNRLESNALLDGVLTRRMIKIQLTWKKIIKLAPSERFDLKQKQKVFSRSIPCRARCCTSLVTVSPSVLDLGECNIGDLKSSSFTITNQSDLTAVILPVVESGSLDLLEKEISIPPHQSRPCHFEFVARAVDDNYSKRVTLLNLYNSHSNVQIEIRAKTVDTHQLLEHSALYKISTRNNKKQLQVYFENCISNMPNLRTFTIQNMSQKDLTFNFSVAQGSDLEIYAINIQEFRTHKSKRLNSKSTTNFLSLLAGGGPSGSSGGGSGGGGGGGGGGGSTMDLESGLDVEKTRRIGSSVTTKSLGRQIRRSSSFGNEADLSILQEGERKRIVQEPTLSDKSRGLESKSDEKLNNSFPEKDFLSLMDLPGFPFAFLESTEEKKETSDLPARSKQANQISQAITLINSCFQELHEEIQTSAQYHHLGGGRLRPLCTSSILSSVVVPVGRTVDIVVILTPKGKQNRNTEEENDAQVLVRDIKLDVVESHDSFTQLSQSLKSRTIVVRARLFESEMVINQKNINFGKTVVGELSTRGLTITNKSSIPLLYSITKSGSISSFFLTVSNDREKGMVRALSTKTIEFAFKPNLSGLYEETLTLENVLNASNSQPIIIKANVLKLQLFQLLPFEKNSLLSMGADEDGPELTEFDHDLLSYLNSKQQETLSLSPLSPFVLPGLNNLQIQNSFQFKFINVSNKQRMFIIEFIQLDLGETTLKSYLGDANVELHAAYAITNQLEQSKSGLTAEEKKYLEDKLEKLSQKLVIAKRKENAEKIIKYEKKLADLRSKLEIDNQLVKETSQESDPATEPPVPISFTLDESGKLSFNLSPEEGALVVVTISATFKSSIAPPNCPLPTCGMLKIYEGKNRDDVKYLYFGTGFTPSFDQCNCLPDISPQQSQMLEGDTPLDPSVLTRPTSIKEIVDRPFFIEVQESCSFNSRKYYPRYRTSIGIILKNGLELVRDKSDISLFVGEFSVISEASINLMLTLSIIDDLAPNFQSEYSNLFSLSSQGDWKIHLNSQNSNNNSDNNNTPLISSSQRDDLRVSLNPGERVTCRLLCTIPTTIREFFTGLIGIRLSNMTIAETPDSKIIPILCNTIREADIITDKHILLGEIHLGKVYTHSLLLKNKSLTEVVSYSATLSPSNSGLQIISGGEGVISINGTTQILLTFEATVLGKYDYLLHITNIKSNSTVTVAVNAIVTLPQSKFVIYPDIDCDDTGKSNKLEIGFIQVPIIKPNEFEKKIEFRILNTSNERLYVSALSNLKKQVLIYSDKECTTMTSNFPLEPGHITTLIISIRPANTPQDGAEMGRELVGGIRFIYFVQDIDKEEGKDDEILRKVYESSVMFKAIIGRSKLRIIPTCTQFHCSRFDSTKNGLIKGYLTLENISPTFPLSYLLPGVEDLDEVFSSQDMRNRRIQSQKKVRFVVFDGCKGFISPLSKKMLRFAVFVDDVSGVMIKTLSFENLFTLEIETLELKFFFDSRALISYYPSSGPGLGENVYLPNNKFHHLPGLLYSQGFFVTELTSRKISTPIWIAPFFSKNFPSNQKLSLPTNDVTMIRNSGAILPEPVYQDSIYITTGGDPVILFQWKITNPSKNPLRIAPASDLPITVSFESSSIAAGTEIKQIYMKRNSRNESDKKIGLKAKSSQSEEQQRGSMTSLPQDLQRRGFSICGDVTTVPPLSTMTVKVGYKKGQPLNASHYQHLLIGDRNSIGSVVVAGGITFISAAQSLQSFFRPTEQEEKTVISKTAAAEEGNDTCPVIHFTPITCHFVVPSIKILKTQVNLGLIRSYKPYFFTLEVENLSDVDIPFRIENLSSWMLVLNAETRGQTNDPKSNSKKTNVTMTAKYKSITTIEFKVNAPLDSTDKSVLHTLRIRNIALSTPQSYSLRDATTIDISFEIDSFNPLQLKDSITGNLLPLSRITHCPYLKLTSEISVPRRTDVTDLLLLFSTGKFTVQNTSAMGLRVLPTIKIVDILDGIVGVTLKRCEEGSGVATLPDDELEMIDLLPGDTLKLSIELSSYQSSRLNEELLMKLETIYNRGDVLNSTQDDDHDADSPEEVGDNIPTRPTIGPILITKILLKFSALIDTSATWPTLLGDGKVVDTSVPEEITLDVIGSLVLSPTTTLVFPTPSSPTSHHSLDISVALADGNMRTGIFWKCQPLNLPLQILTPTSTLTLQNLSQHDSKYRIVNSSLMAIPDGHGKSIDLTQLVCDNISFMASPSQSTIPTQETIDIHLELSLQPKKEEENEENEDDEEDNDEVENEDEDGVEEKEKEKEKEEQEENTEFFEKLFYHYFTISQKANASLSPKILAVLILAIYDLSYPLHPPFICPVYVKRVAESKVEMLDSIESSSHSPHSPHAPHSPLRKEVESTSLVNHITVPTLFLRGVTPCLPYANQFEINFGQQFQNTESSEWTLSLENMSTTSKLRYRISTLSPDDSKWISLAQSGGTINPGGTASLILYFSLRQVGVFATYLIIENLTNPNDTCVIRTSVQVVQDWRKRNLFVESENNEDQQQLQRALFRIESSQIIRDPGPFRAAINSWNNLDTATSNKRRAYIRSPTAIDFSHQVLQVIDFGQVFVGQRYTRRSFAIVNLTDISLDFQLSSNISPRELSFSLTPVSPRTCCMVTVQPRERRFVYVIFRPLTRENQKLLSTSRKDEKDDGYLENSRRFWKIDGCIFVSCNLVKNHHETVKVFAHCGLRMFGTCAIKQLNQCPLLTTMTAIASASPTVTVNTSTSTSGILNENEYENIDPDSDKRILQVSVPEHNDLGLETLVSESISAVEGVSLFAGTDYSWHSANCILIRMVDPSLSSSSTTASSFSQGVLQIRIYSCMKSFRLEVYRSFKSNGDEGVDQQLELLPLIWAKGGGENGGSTVDFEITSPVEEYIVRVLVDNHNLNCRNDVTNSSDERNRYGRYCIGAEDHFMIYNRTSPIEKCRIPVRLLLPSGLNCSDLSGDDDIPTTSSSVSTLSFSDLEGIIISYFKEFSIFWSDVLSLTNESIIARSDLPQHHPPLLENSVTTTNQMNHHSSFMISMAEHSQNNDYITYGGRNGTDILTALEYFFLRLKYCITITESEMIQNKRMEEFIRVYPEEEEIFPLLLSLSSRYLDICFHFGAITDLIVLYSMRQSSFGHEIMTAAHTGLPVGRLALLFYSIVFRHPVFEIISKIPPEYCREGIGSILSVPLYPFAKQILYYGSFFSHSNLTDGNHDHNPLVDIIKSVKASFIDMKM